MAVLPLCSRHDPVLRKKAKKVTRIDKQILRLIDDMIETMRAVSGVGLAAPQVGISLKIAVIQVPDQEVIVLINPEIIKSGGVRELTEACLSVPGYYGEIERAMWVKVKAHDVHGREFRLQGEGLLAQALEHEIDHLNGKLYIDHLSSPEKLCKVTPPQESDNEPQSLPD